MLDEGDLAERVIELAERLGSPMSREDVQAAAKNLSDPIWRITSGQLYRIQPRVARTHDEMINGIPFVPNEAQWEFLMNPHKRAIILKSRQLGYSTLIGLMALDTAIFNPRSNCVILAHTQPAAKALLKDRIRFAYDRLPAALRALAPIANKSVEVLIFAHNESSLSVTVSARSGTVHFLHVSEFAKIHSLSPMKAEEVNSGSIQAVVPGGHCYIESTAAGAVGPFYDMATDAARIARSGRELSEMDYRFVFTGWTMDVNCTHPDPASVSFSEADHVMFGKMEEELGEEIPLDKRAWYVTKRNREFSSRPHVMLQEYPTTPEEAFRVSTEGRYYAAALARATAEGRIMDRLPVRTHVPVNAVFDLGDTDFTTCWLHQRDGAWDNWIGYKEEAGTGFMPFIRWIERFVEDHNAVTGTMYLPHDAMAMRRDGLESPVSLFSMVRNVKPQWNWVVVEQVPRVLHGIELVRHEFPGYRFDHAMTEIGIRHLGNYQARWSPTAQAYMSEHLHNEASHAADALRQLPQAREYGISDTSKQGVPKRRRRARRATTLTA